MQEAPKLNPGIYARIEAVELPALLFFHSR